MQRPSADVPGALAEADGFYQAGRLDEAAQLCRKILAAEPDHAETLHNRGVALHDLARFEEALASYDRALAVRPGYVRALNSRANVLRELGRLEDSLASCDQALAIDPNDPETW